MEKYVQVDKGNFLQEYVIYVKDQIKKREKKHMYVFSARKE